MSDSAISSAPESTSATSFLVYVWRCKPAKALAVIITDSLALGMRAPWRTAVSMVRRQQNPGHPSSMSLSRNLKRHFRRLDVCFLHSLPKHCFYFVQGAAARIHLFPISSVFCFTAYFEGYLYDSNGTAYNVICCPPHRSFVVDRSSFALGRRASTLYTGRRELHKMKHGKFSGSRLSAQAMANGRYAVRTCFGCCGGSLLRPRLAAVVRIPNPSYQKWHIRLCSTV